MITRWLTFLLKRLPIGWLQLSYNKTRLSAAITGVAFANILVFVQLGIIGAFNTSIANSYSPFVADIIISASDANTLEDGASISRRYLYQSLSISGVKAVSPLYIGKLNWILENGNLVNTQVYGIPPESSEFIANYLQGAFAHLKLQNTMLVDALTRGFDTYSLPNLLNGNTHIELNNIALTVVDSFNLGLSLIHI